MYAMVTNANLLFSVYLFEVDGMDEVLLCVTVELLDGFVVAE